MIWVDGSIYKGRWVKGIQDGIGLMKFTDGEKRAGIFKNNIYKKEIETPLMLEEALKMCMET
jgi:hypothetical protein